MSPPAKPGAYLVELYKCIIHTTLPFKALVAQAPRFGAPARMGLLAHARTVPSKSGIDLTRHIFHFSKYRDSQDGLFQPLMSLGDEAYFTFATGWMWSLPAQSADNRQLSIDLAEYLTEDEFLASWINEAGYLPTRGFAGEEAMDETVTALIEASRPAPSADTLLILGPPMRDALIRVLNGEQPDAVARSIIEELR